MIIIMLAVALCRPLLTSLLLIRSLAGSSTGTVLFAGTAYYVEAGIGYRTIQVLRNAFSGNWTPNHPPILTLITLNFTPS